MNIGAAPGPGGSRASDSALDLGKYGADSTCALRRYLRDRWKDTEALFPSRQADRMSARSISRAVTRAAEIGDVAPQVVDGSEGAPDQVTAHTLRHSVAYRIIREESGRLEDVQLRLRHASRRTTDEIYSHLRAPDKANYAIHTLCPVCVAVCVARVSDVI